MRKLLLVALLTGFLPGCSKHDTSPVAPYTTDEPQIPPAETINTRIAGFMIRPDNTLFSNVLLNVNNLSQQVNITDGGFIGESFSTDKYVTRFILNDPAGVEKNRTLPLTSARLNYVRIKPMAVNAAGTLHNGSGGQFTFDNSGSFTIPANAIYEQPRGIYPGFYDENINAPIHIGYINPLSSDFAVSIPCYSMADDDDKRWFLASLGVVRVSAGYVWIPSDESEFDFYNTNNGSGTLKMPVAADLSVALPDSIPLWRLSNGRWVKSVTAKKSGGFYIATIKKMGAYNLAIPVKGVYRTIRLRTNDGTPVLNATVKIKRELAVLAEAQTDWEGNALLFLPAGQNLTVEIYGVTWQPGSPVLTAAISTAAATKEIDVTINPSLPEVYTFRGNAKACNGTAVATGEIILHNRVLHTVDWHIPVTGGTFNASIIDGTGGDYLYYARLVDQVAGVTGTDTAFAVAGGSAKTYTFNTCPLQTNLYMNFSVDGVNTSITGDLSHAENPYLKALPNNTITMLAADNGNGQGLQFSTHAFNPGVYTYIDIDNLFVNGQAFFYDINKPTRVTFDRYDLQPGGIVSGSADFWYIDQTNVHHLEASFRLQKQF